jgi:hypothetical protein
MIENLQKRIDAKTLEIAALDRLRSTAGPILSTALQDADSGPNWEPILHNASAAVSDYFTALRDQESITLEEWQIQIRGFQAAHRQMESGIVTPAGMKVGRG